LSVRITAAVNLILTTVTSFASLIPHTSGLTARIAVTKGAIPRASDLRKQWNLQVCGATGNVALDAAFAVCVVK